MRSHTTSLGKISLWSTRVGKRGRRRERVHVCMEMLKEVRLKKDGHILVQFRMNYDLFTCLSKRN